MMKRLIYSMMIAACSFTTLSAQEKADTIVYSPTIADHINVGRYASVTQPEGLNMRLVSTTEEKKNPAAAAGGYRIQAFSGNNARTAKRDADNRAAAINEKYPEYATYVTFDSPYWRLKVGDFNNYDDAAAALAEMKRSFPTFSREMRLVRDRINIKD